jgi:hypothetical protein
MSVPNNKLAVAASPPLRGNATTTLALQNTAGSGAAVQPEPSRSKRKERIVRIEINSNDRDVVKDKNPANFQWISPYPLKNVTSIVIVGGTVPVPLYTIDEPYNCFLFDTGTAIYTLRFPPGLYTPILFAPAFKKLLDATDGINLYTVKVDPVTQILSVKTNGQNHFGFLFGTGAPYVNVYNPGLQKMLNPALMMGFADEDIYSVGNPLDGQVITAPNPVILNPVQRIYLYLNYESTMDLRSIVLGGGRAGPSAILYCTDADSVAYYTKSLNKDTYENVISPNLIVPRIRTIQVSLQDEFGNVLNTNRRPVSFLLEVTVLD